MDIQWIWFYCKRIHVKEVSLVSKVWGKACPPIVRHTVGLVNRVRAHLKKLNQELSKVTGIHHIRFLCFVTSSYLTAFSHLSVLFIAGLVEWVNGVSSRSWWVQKNLSMPLLKLQRHCECCRWQSIYAFITVMHFLMVLLQSRQNERAELQALRSLSLHIQLSSAYVEGWGEKRENAFILFKFIFTFIIWTVYRCAGLQEAPKNVSQDDRCFCQLQTRDRKWHHFTATLPLEFGELFWHNRILQYDDSFTYWYSHTVWWNEFMLTWWPVISMFSVISIQNTFIIPA